MSTYRLTFLYPPLFRSLRISEAPLPLLLQTQTRNRASRSQRQCLNRRHRGERSFTSSSRRNDILVKRHGKAVEPLRDGEKEIGIEEGDRLEREMQRERMERPSSAAPLSEETQMAAKLPGDEPLTKTEENSAKGENERGDLEGKQVDRKGEVEGKEKSGDNIKEDKPDASAPLASLETVLQMPPPETQEEENAAKPPHLQTPPYVHHFDTYTLVQQVGAGGFTTDQSITAMKAVRGILALNLDVAKKGLVSKSDVENETYLFRAACSELKTEIQNSRKKNEETMRRERTLLQHEVDILNQKLTQELLTLKDDLKGMFDDRKMSVRMEQRTMESKIQELNYKITVLLNSDSKSEIEGLRWVLTRRSVMGILFMAFMVLTSLRYASYKSHEEEIKKKKEEIISKAEMEVLDELPAQGAAEILAAN